MIKKCSSSQRGGGGIISIYYLVFGVGGVDPLAVSAGLQQDLDGVELQQDLTGHAVEEGDVGQSCRRQQENLPAGGALAQLCQTTVTEQERVTAGNASSCTKALRLSLTDERGDDVVHALQEAGQMLRGRVVRGRNLSHDRGRLSPGRFHTAVIGQDVGQAQDSIHLPMAKSFPLSRQTF